MKIPALTFDAAAGLTTLNPKLPAAFLKDARPSERFWEFFAANMRNRNTRRAYYKAACRFNDSCEERGLSDLGKIKLIHVAAVVEERQRIHFSPP